MPVMNYCEAIKGDGRICTRRARWWIPARYGGWMAACEDCAPNHGASNWKRLRTKA